jgi:KDO2-lipid IV(A) lauroyltransferase
LSSKKGFIVCTGHIGNFELFGVYSARRKVPLTILTRPLKGAANAHWVGTRAMAGIKEIHKGMENLIESIRRNEVLAMLIDQNMQPRRAIFLPFFGKLAATTPAPAVIAERTGAPAFLGMTLRKPDGRYRTLFEGPFFFERTSGDRQADIRAFSAMINERFERQVREHPEQWFWVHRRWKTRPPTS